MAPWMTDSRRVASLTRATARGTPRTIAMRTALLVLGPLLALAAVEPAGDWPQFRGPGRDGISAERGWSHAWPDGGPARRWRAEVGAGYSSLAISGGALYTLGNSADE